MKKKTTKQEQPMPKNMVNLDKVTASAFNEAILLFLTLGVLSGLLVYLVGCQLPVKSLTPTNPAQALAETVAKTNWVIALSIAGIAVSVMAWINGSKTAIGVLIGCVVALWLQITVIRYASVLAVAGLVVAIGLGVWTVFVKNRALEDIVNGVQNYKRSANVPLKQFLGEQAGSTKKIVSQIKGKLPGKKV